MKKICALLVICSIGLFSVGCEKKAGTGPGGTNGSSTTGTAPAGTSTGTK